MAGSELVVRIRDSQGNNVDNFGGTVTPPASIATGQVPVATSSTLVAAARAARKSITLTPTSSTVYYVGNNGVTTATGVYVPAGASITLVTTAAIYAVGAAALTLSFYETF